jgi:hypothetical protein
VNRRQMLSGSIAAAMPVGSAAQSGSQANQAIESARQAALHALKPSKRDLEHGLELHPIRLSSTHTDFRRAPR